MRNADRLAGWLERPGVEPLNACVAKSESLKPLFTLTGLRVVRESLACDTAGSASTLGMIAASASHLRRPSTARPPRVESVITAPLAAETRPAAFVIPALRRL